MGYAEGNTRGFDREDMEIEYMDNLIDWLNTFVDIWHFMKNHENFSDTVKACGFFTSAGVQLYSGIDEIAKQLDLKIEWYKEPNEEYPARPTVIWKDVPFFQLEKKEGEFTK